jgi:RNA polymerase sigma factor (sigma-70 family)
MAASEPPLVAAYFERRQSLVRAFTAKLRSASQAEDLIQDLYLKVAAADPDQPVDDSSALLFRMANNLMLDRLRSARRAAVRDQAWSDVEIDAAGGEAASREPSAETTVSDRQSLRQLLDAVENLPPRTRRAFELHKLDGLSYGQTAQTMGTSPKTVEKQISAALARLVAVLSRGSHD